MKLKIKNTFTKHLPADPITDTKRREVARACFSYVNPKLPLQPKLIHASDDVAKLLGIAKEELQTKAFLNIVTGTALIDNTRPYAMCYGGHQFGHWAGQLGDGRAINLAEIEYNMQRWALQLKGAGETPYSRTADGLAVLRSSIREHLCSEAMHYLGVPTTRSLSLALSGNKVLRDVLYNGNANYEKGAIVCRVAASFIRFGNFEIFASRQDVKTLKALTDYTINEHYPNIITNTKFGYLEFFKTVAENTLNMIINWQRVGFVHGVMNTDNMSILGLTIDYGPYGWLEAYDVNWTPNTTDNQFKRYRYGNQPKIALWNLLQLANALYPLIEDAEALEQILHDFNIDYKSKYLDMMRSKLGLQDKNESDAELVTTLEKVLQLTETDMTIFFRNLANISKTRIIDDEAFLDAIKDAFYKPQHVTGTILKQWQNWFLLYTNRLKKEALPDAERKRKMNAVNPKYILRNYIAQLIINDADKGNYTLLNKIHTLLKNPYNEQEEHQEWFVKRPEWARNKVGCSMLSCSS